MSVGAAYGTAHTVGGTALRADLCVCVCVCVWWGAGQGRREPAKRFEDGKGRRWQPMPHTRYPPCMPPNCSPCAQSTRIPQPWQTAGGPASPAGSDAAWGDGESEGAPEVRKRSCRVAQRLPSDQGPPAGACRAPDATSNKAGTHVATLDVEVGHPPGVEVGEGLRVDGWVGGWVGEGRGAGRSWRRSARTRTNKPNMLRRMCIGPPQHAPDPARDHLDGILRMHHMSRGRR